VCGLTASEGDRDMPHRRIGLSAMPMALTGLDMRDIAHVDLGILHSLHGAWRTCGLGRKLDSSGRRPARHYVEIVPLTGTNGMSRERLSWSFMSKRPLLDALP
jgi:hypothetical protein